MRSKTQANQSINQWINQSINHISTVNVQKTLYCTDIISFKKSIQFVFSVICTHLRLLDTGIIMVFFGSCLINIKTIERNFCLQDMAEDDVSINNRLFLQTWNIRFYPHTSHACLIKPISWSILWIISLKTRELVKLPHSFNELIKSYPWYTNQSNKNDFLFSLYTFPVVKNTGEFDFEAFTPRWYKWLWLYKKMDIEVLYMLK